MTAEPLTHKQGLFSGKFVVLEGGWKASRLVILRFPGTSALQSRSMTPSTNHSRREIVSVEGHDLRAEREKCGLTKSNKAKSEKPTIRPCGS